MGVRAVSSPMVNAGKFMVLPQRLECLSQGRYRFHPSPFFSMEQAAFQFFLSVNSLLGQLRLLSFCRSLPQTPEARATPPVNKGAEGNLSPNWKLGERFSARKSKMAFLPFPAHVLVVLWKAKVPGQ